MSRVEAQLNPYVIVLRWGTPFFSSLEFERITPNISQS